MHQVRCAIGLEEGVGHAEEGRVPRVARAGHDDGRLGVTRQETTGRTPAHPTFRILNLQYVTTLEEGLIYTVNRQNIRNWISHFT